MIAPLVLVYLLIGSMVWVLLDPARYADFVNAWWLKRHKELPGTAVQILAVFVVIAIWPRMFVKMWRG